MINAIFYRNAVRISIVTRSTIRCQFNLFTQRNKTRQLKKKKTVKFKNLTIIAYILYKKLYCINFKIQPNLFFCFYYAQINATFFID